MGHTNLAVEVVGLHTLVPPHVALADCANMKLAIDRVAQNNRVAAIFVIGTAPMADTELASLTIA